MIISIPDYYIDPTDSMTTSTVATATTVLPPPKKPLSPA